ncbi:MAG: tryptophanase [Candidatus Kapabacteria bacterium]|jgi:tryptophanase|nr:tryptophanase [Candidatus Kapabacteria bacterium]
MKTLIEPFKIKSIEEIPILTVEQRTKLLNEADLNPFTLRSSSITIDMLTDSGTTAMSAKQWAALMDGDESYAGSRSYFKFEDKVRELTGFKHIIPVHQGRAAERILFNVLDVKGKTVPNNTHFDTTRGNIEFNEANAVDIPCPEGVRPDIIADFKGNMDLDSLRNVIKEVGTENIPVVMMTITNNSGGGQPVSMANIRGAAKIAHDNKLPFFLDCCRFAENAYFIKQREEGYADKSVMEITNEMFSYADGCTMSAKKDGLANTGGFIAMNDDMLAEKSKTVLIVTEGFPTYGGLARRDLEALAVGFDEVMKEEYLSYRLGQVKYLGDKLVEAGVPLLLPTGGHGIYLDAKAFAPHIKPENFPGQSISCEIYRISGIRSVEIGSVMFGKKDENGNHIGPAMELVRFAIPRRVYTKSHIDYVAEAIIEVYNNREKLRPMEITWEAPFLRHFTAKFKFVD